MKRIFKSASVSQTKKEGAALAGEALGERKTEGSFILALEGDLGAGKTVFLQGFARGLGVREGVLSPTFSIFKKYKAAGKKKFFHFDCYRISKPKEILDLGFENIVADPDGIIAIEWADRIKKIIPKRAFWASFFIKGEKERIVAFKKAGGRKSR